MWGTLRDEEEPVLTALLHRFDGGEPKRFTGILDVLNREFHFGHGGPACKSMQGGFERKEIIRTTRPQQGRGS